MDLTLSANPLKSIGIGARRLVQVQVAYLGFLNQLSLLKFSPNVTDENALQARSKQLGEAITNCLEALEKHFG